MNWGIIGTAGRKDVLTELNFGEAKWDWMVRTGLSFVGESPLVSGGAALSDQVAVEVHRRFGNPLTLHLPAEMAPGGYRGGRTASTSNFHHHRFSRSIGGHFEESLKALWWVLPNCTVTVEPNENFFARNSLIARDSHHIIAFTQFGRVSGGTGDTIRKWRKKPSRGKLIMVNLSTGSIKEL